MRKLAVLVASMLLVMVMVFPAQAHHKEGHDGGPPEVEQSESPGADFVAVCKYTGVPPGGFHHRIKQVSRQAAKAPGFADAHDSIIVETDEPCPTESEPDEPDEPKDPNEPDEPKDPDPEPETPDEPDEPANDEPEPVEPTEKPVDAPERELENTREPLDPEPVEPVETVDPEPEPAPQELPRTGLGTLLMSLLGFGSIAGGTVILRRT